MSTIKVQKYLSIILITIILGNMIVLPGTVQARPEPQAVRPGVQAVIAGGATLTDAGPQLMFQAMQLAQAVDTINGASLQVISEQTLEDTRQNAWQTAQEAARLQGALGSILTGLNELAFTPQTASDVPSDVTDLASSGFDSELATELAGSSMNLSSAEITQLENQTVDNFQARQQPLPQELKDALSGYGATQTDIDQIEAAFQNTGLADENLGNKLGQLQAMQDEMGIVRTEAIVAYLQMLTKQVVWRQLVGQAPRELDTADVSALAQDEARLLLHLNYVKSLWSGTPDPDVGEGQWLFVQRYSQRTIERLEQLILETHNLGPGVDLFVALQINGIATAALAGDADYAAAQLDPYIDLLVTLTGEDPLGEEQGWIAPPLWWQSALALSQRQEWDLDEWLQPEPDNVVVAIAEQELQGRVKGLAYPLWHPALQPDDNDPHRDEALFYTELFDLPSGVLDKIMEVLGDDGPFILEVIIGAITGQSDNWWAIGANVVLGFLPVTGMIIDFIGIFSEPSVWGKAFSIIGLLASLLSDGSQAIAAIGLVFPPALVLLVPLAGAAEFIDIAASLLRRLGDFLSTAALNAIQKFDTDYLEGALQIAGQLIMQVARQAYPLLTDGWDSLPANVKNFVLDAINVVIVPFDYLARIMGKFEDLETRGFEFAGYLIGRTGKKNGVDAVTNIDGLAEVGKDLQEIVYDLSDDAVGGLGKLASKMDRDDFPQLVNKLCDGAGTAHLGNYRGPGLARPLSDKTCSIHFQRILENIVNLDEVALDGFKKLGDANVDLDALANLLETYADNPELLNAGFGIFARIDFVGKWRPSDDSLTTMFSFINRDGKDQIEYWTAYNEALLNRVFDTGIDDLFDQQFKSMVTRLDGDFWLRKMVAHDLSPDEVRNGVIQTLRNAEHPNTPWPSKHGYNFQLDRGKYYEENEELRSFEFVEQIGTDQYSYDLRISRSGFAVDTVVEVKYWRKSTIENNITKLFNQVDSYTDSGHPVILEIGETATNPATNATIALVRTELIKRGISPSDFIVTLIPRN